MVITSNNRITPAKKHKHTLYTTPRTTNTTRIVRALSTYINTHTETNNLASPQFLYKYSTKKMNANIVTRTHSSSFVCGVVRVCSSANTGGVHLLS